VVGVDYSQKDTKYEVNGRGWLMEPFPNRTLLSTLSLLLSLSDERTLSSTVSWFYLAKVETVGTHF